MTRKVALLAAALAVALTATAAASADNGRHAFDKAAKASHVGPGSILDAVTTYLQVDRKTLLKELADGKSLAQIAAAHGKTAAGIVDAVVAKLKPRLDAREEAKLRAALDSVVTKSFAPKTIDPTFLKPYFQPALDYLQIDLPTLLQELKGGKSLGDIAVAHGKTAAGLTTAIVAPLKTELDEKVGAGKLTAAQRDAVLATLHKAVAALVTPRG